MSESSVNAASAMSESSGKAGSPCKKQRAGPMRESSLTSTSSGGNGASIGCSTGLFYNL